MRQCSPRAAVLGLVEDGVPYLAQWVAAWRAGPAILRWRHGTLYDLPLAICQIRRVRHPAHALSYPTATTSFTGSKSTTLVQLRTPSAISNSRRMLSWVISVKL